MLTLDAFEARSPGIGASGPVAVSGSQDTHGVSRLLVSAFGKHMELDAALLDKLHGFHFNGMQISYEEGYEELGGRTLYIMLSKGFTSGVVSRKFVVVTEDGAIKVRDDLR
ncbi:hypothetical protein [Luteibacter aegosomatissinici]|uniref:hypothetical protein n=1 Tax=Luteibacter aegosomatissinici TaxID=2911539 RepID=UPI001FFB1E01|nr:hypothetical protein [Luteibacter aegosomatissinici]UPG95288.1 hypothetical protein L2Y97_04010 [Luteibacter aegosomatissinici]